MRTIIMAALTDKGVIGTGNALPWHIPEDYNLFLDHIKGQTIIMGRRSFEIFKKDMLPDINIVVSRRIAEMDNAIITRSLNEAINKAQEYGNDIYIAGGREIYKEALGLADRMYLSHIKQDYPGEVYFPEVSWTDWNAVYEKEYKDFIFRKYEKMQEAVRGRQPLHYV